MNRKSYNSSNFLIDEFERKIQISLSSPGDDHNLLLSSIHAELQNCQKRDQIIALRQSFYVRSTSLEIKVANITCDKNFIAFRSSCGRKQFTHKYIFFSAYQLEKHPSFILFGTVNVSALIFKAFGVMSNNLTPAPRFSCEILSPHLRPISFPEPSVFP